MNIQPLILVLSIIAVLLAAGLIGWFTHLHLSRSRLKKKFGPEYDYMMEKLGDRRTAETNLKEREKRVVKLDIHDLNEHEQDRYHSEWTEIQADFVDDPAKSVERANRLITEVMIARGFPVADFEQRTADLSVLYPNFVLKYRQANAIATKNHNEGASTEELRQAMIDYHSLFHQLLGRDYSKEHVREMETA